MSREFIARPRQDRPAFFARHKHAAHDGRPEVGETGRTRFKNAEPSSHGLVISERIEPGIPRSSSSSSSTGDDGLHRSRQRVSIQECTHTAAEAMERVLSDSPRTTMNNRPPPSTRRPNDEKGGEGPKGRYYYGAAGRPRNQRRAQGRPCLHPRYALVKTPARRADAVSDDVEQRK